MTKRHTIGTHPAQTRHRFRDSVLADEGGGLTTPHPSRGGVCPAAVAPAEVTERDTGA